VGLDFLPRGDGVVTRRPLELRLCHIPDGEGVKPWAVFEERKGQKFYDFDKVRQTIEDLTDEVTKGDKNIVDIPIILNVYSPTCPDLTLIDLPGITRFPVGKQPKNIEEITRNMAVKYCKDPMTIILCVIQANNDIAVSDGLPIAKEIDTEGKRTIGVLTKLDIMDKGTDAKKALLNQEVPLTLGYVGVKNRSKQDLNDKISMKDALKAEKEFFSTHPVYKTLPPGVVGTDVLIQKLTKKSQ
jgi:replication fork clamp-binding protein CrfC